MGDLSEEAIPRFLAVVREEIAALRAGCRAPTDAAVAPAARRAQA
jgi:hypothetical protein